MRLWSPGDDRTVKLQLDRLSAVLDPLQPARGLQQFLLDGQSQSAFHPLAPQFEPSNESSHVPQADSIGESYIRGGDLVSSYPDRPAAGLSTQLYWRADAHQRHGALATVELVTSVQTSLLDSCPRVVVQSELLAGEVYRLVDAERDEFASIVPPSHDADPDTDPRAPHCYLFRLPGRQHSYVEMIHPADGQNTHWDGWLHDTEFRLRLRHELFADRLEKGVILRARILGVVLDRRNDKAAAARHWREFLQAELPLTT